MARPVCRVRIPDLKDPGKGGGVSLSYSLTFLPEEDRIILWFRSRDEDVPDPVLLTRRMTRVLGGFLRKALENISGLPDHLGEADISEVMQFFHDQELESAPVEWNADQPARGAQAAEGRLVSRVDTAKNHTHLTLSCFNEEIFLAQVTLDWKGVHRFLDSLAQMGRMADWGLDEELIWKAPQDRGGQGRHPREIN